MVMHVTNDAMFELPDVGFVDRTAHDLDLDLGPGASLGMLVVRTPLVGGASLHAAVREHVLTEAKRLAGYRLLEEAAAELGGRPAFVVAARWSHGAAELYTREAHAACGAVRLSLAMTSPLARRAICDEHFAHVTGSFRFS